MNASLQAEQGQAPVPGLPVAALVQAQGLTLAPAGPLILRGLNFDIRAGEIFVIIGGSGCGKSVLLRHLIGLQRPAAGQVMVALGADAAGAAAAGYATQGAIQGAIQGALQGPLQGATSRIAQGAAPSEPKPRWVDLYACSEADLTLARRQFGVMFQAGALWSSMSVGENLMLPLRLFTGMPPKARRDKALEKLALLGLDHSFNQMPGALSGGMRKRVAMARALVLEPPLVYLDEPASGLDPVNTQRLDELILALREKLGTAVVMVTHAIDSVFAVADRALFLDAQDKTMLALDSPAQLAANGPPRVREFLEAGR